MPPCNHSFYTYLYLRYDGTPYYVGKGSGDRVYRRFGRTVKPPADKSLIIIEEHESEQDAFTVEMFFIAYYGRIDLGTGCLRNMTDGGEGKTGHVPSDDTRLKISASQLGRKNPHGPTRRGYKATEETRRRMSKALQGRAFTETTRFRMRQAALGRTLSPEARKKVAAASTGRTQSVEARTKIANAHRGRKHTDASRQNMSQAHLGKKHTDETRRRMSESHRRRRMLAGLPLDSPLQK